MNDKKQNDDFCLMCGAYVPEGRDICPNCEAKVKKDSTEVIKKCNT